MRERSGKLLGAADIGNGAGPSDGLGSFHLKTKGFCRRGKVLAGLGALGKLVRAGFCQLDRLFMAVVGGHAVANLGKGRGMRRQNFLYGQNHVAAVGVDGSAQVAHSLVEDGIEQRGRVPEFRQRLIGLHQLCLSGGHVELLGHILDRNASAAADFLGDLIGKRLGQLLGLFLLQLRQDGRL